MDQTAEREPVICVFVGGTPKAQPRPRISYCRGETHVFSNHSGVGKWKAALEAKFRLSAPLKPYEGPLSLELIFYSLGPARILKKKHPVPESQALVYDESVPDLDNLAKPVMDALKNAGVIHDDAQVVILSVRKYKCLHPAYADPGVYVNLSPAPRDHAAMSELLEHRCGDDDDK